MPSCDSRIVGCYDSIQNPITLEVRKRINFQERMLTPPGVVSMMHEKYTRPVPVERVAFADVDSLKALFAVINELNDKIPMGRRLSHIHRVSGTHIIVASLDAVIEHIMKPDDQFWSYIIRGGHSQGLNKFDYVHRLNSGANNSAEKFVKTVEMLLEFVKVSDEEVSLLRYSRDTGSVVHVANVPQFRPLLQWQYDLAKRHWPCDFEVDQHAENQFANKVHDADEVRFHKTIMRVVNYVREMSGIQECGLAVNPNTRNIVGLAFRNEDLPGSPMSHCPMVLMNNLALELINPPPAQAPGNHGEIVPRRGGVASGWRRELGDYFPTIRFGTQLGDAVAEQGGRFWPIVGYDMYLSREPCLRCAMTMKSKRILSVFYDEPHRRGALGSNKDTAYQPFDILKNVYRVI